VAAKALARVPGIEVVAPPQLSLLAFRLEPPEATPSEQATRLLLDRVNARGRVMLTGCTTGGRFLGRICVLSFRTRRRHVEAAVEQIGEEAVEILAGRTRPCAG
jgi:aromatic-L-amino-acid decarboxylase